MADPKTIPRLKPGLDLTSLPIDAMTGFLLSRIDGETAAEDLAQLTGRTVDDVCRMLDEMQAQGYVEFSTAGGGATERAPAPPRPPAMGSGDIRETVRQPAAGGSGGAGGGGVSAIQGTAVSFSSGYDSGKELESEEKDKILRMSKTIQRQNYYEVLGIKQKADRREVKRAFFMLSKEFHPDVYFGYRLGSFGPKLEAIYQTITEARDTLIDEAARKAYEVEVGLRKERKTAPREGPKNPLLFAGKTNPFTERLEKAQKYFEQARDALQAKDYSTALSQIQLAISFNPDETAYLPIRDEAQHHVNKRLAEQEFRKGEFDEDLHNLKEAREHYQKAVELDPSVRKYQSKMAEVCWEWAKDPSSAKPFAERAAQMDPTSVELNLYTAELYYELELWPHAKRQYEIVLDLEAKHPDATRRLKELKKRLR